MCVCVCVCPEVCSDCVLLLCIVIMGYMLQFGEIAHKIVHLLLSNYASSIA